MITDREAEDEESRREISFMNYFLSLSLFVCLSVCLSFSKSLDGEIMRDWARDWGQCVEVSASSIGIFFFIFYNITRKYYWNLDEEEKKVFE